MTVALPLRTIACSAAAIAVLGLTVLRTRPANGGHTQLTLRRERDVLDAIAFGRDDLPGVLAAGDRVDVVARVATRAFNGLESLQLEVRDIATSGLHPEAAAILALAPASASVGPAGPQPGTAFR